MPLPPQFMNNVRPPWMQAAAGMASGMGPGQAPMPGQGMMPPAPGGGMTAPMIGPAGGIPQGMGPSGPAPFQAQQPPVQAPMPPQGPVGPPMPVDGPMPPNQPMFGSPGPQAMPPVAAMPRGGAVRGMVPPMPGGMSGGMSPMMLAQALRQRRGG